MSHSLFVRTPHDISTLGFDYRGDGEDHPHHALPPTRSRINPVAQALLEGMLDPSGTSPLSLLSVCPELLADIFERVRKSWVDSLIIGYDNVTVSSWGIGGFPAVNPPPDDKLVNVSLSLVNHVTFPSPKDLHCNMLPFILGNRTTIPPEYRDYCKLIEACPVEDEQVGKVCYLTIHESRMECNESQRRPGIHVEGSLGVHGRCTTLPSWHPWGFGRTGRFRGGLYIASSVSGSSRFWNAQVPRTPSAALGRGCDVEHLRGVLEECAHPVKPKEGELYWLTDATPHEALPLLAGTYRQFFRLVTSEVGVWWERHSTRNRLGIEPACTILTHDKFSGYAC